MNLRASLYSTYSIVARDPASGQLGIAVQTHQMSVGSLVIWLEPGIGAVVTQSLINIGYGPSALALLRQGVPPERILAALSATDDRPQVRQMAVVDAQGRAAAFTGIGCIREAAHHVGEGYSVQANMMTRPTVVPAMAAAYEAAKGDLGQRMLAALQAAQAEGGDIRGMQSAALKVVPGDFRPRGWDRVYDLRVDEHADPLAELARLVRLRHAALVDESGYEALAAGERIQALSRWEVARAEAPELEELPFWQAVALADEHDDVPAAAAILAPGPGRRSAPRSLAGSDRPPGRLRADRAPGAGRGPARGARWRSAKSHQGPQESAQSGQQKAAKGGKHKKS